MVGVSYKDAYNMFLMLRDVISLLQPHPPGCGSLLVDVYDYVTGRPSGSVDTTRMDLLKCSVLWVFIIPSPIMGSVHSPPLRKHISTSRLAKVFKTRQRHKEEKEGSLWLTRFQE